jgi:hypothetical protein
VLVQAMQHPAAGTPHRPTELQVRPDERWESLKPHLGEIGAGLAVAEGLDQLAAVFNEMCAHVCGKPMPGLLDTVFARRTAGSRSEVIRWAGVSCSPP